MTSLDIDVVPYYSVSSSINDFTSKLSKYNPMYILAVIAIIIVYYLVFSSFSKNTASLESYTQTQTNYGSAGITYVEVTLWGLFIFLILINGLQFFLSIDVKAIIQDIFSTEPKLDINVESPMLEPENIPSKPKKEVFHVRDNVYTYNDAENVCKAFDAELASYDQIKDAHKKGGEWCSYGWSKDQLALYPTQKTTYEKLKTIKGHEHDCGRPGINGGYISNPNVRFGANCYGYKPKMTPLESEVMANTPPYPESNENKENDKRVQYFKDNMENILLAPFNKSNWSII